MLMSRDSVFTMMKPLKGKVALLFQDSRSGGWSLAVSLARLGADVTLVCQHGDAEQAQDTKKCIEAEDQHCLIIPVHVLNEVSSTEAIRQTVKMFGGFDLYIDFSFPMETTDETIEGLGQAYELTDNDQQKPLVHLEMLAAALDQIVDIDKTAYDVEQEVDYLTQAKPPQWKKHSQ